MHIYNFICWGLEWFENSHSSKLVSSGKKRGIGVICYINTKEDTITIFVDVKLKNKQNRNQCGCKL